MEEKTFFEKGDVKVTNTRFSFGEESFAISSIRAAKTVEDKPRRVAPILMVLVGGIMIIGGLPEIGLPLAGVCAILLLMQKTIYHVMLTTDEGETSALKTEQREPLDQLVAALNQAIAYRA